MYVYIFLFLIFTLVAFFDFTNLKRRNKNYLLICCGFICIFLSGIRWNTGTDWLAYFEFFQNNSTIDEFVSGEFEIGYSLMNYIFKSITNEYNLFLFFIATIIIGIKYKFIYMFSAFPLLSLFINFSNNLGDIFPVRQSIAIALTFYSVTFIIERKVLLFCFYVLFASIFHVTALIFLPAYFIYYKKFSKKQLCILSMMSIIMGVVGFFQYILETLDIFIQIPIFFKLFDYFLANSQGENFGSIVSVSAIVFFGSLKRAIFLPILIYLKDKVSKKDSLFNGFFNLMIFGYWIYFVLISLSNVVANRLSVYYSSFEILAIPCLFHLISKKVLRIYLFFVLVVYCGLKFYINMYASYYVYIPYWTIFK